MRTQKGAEGLEAEQLQWPNQCCSCVIISTLNYRLRQGKELKLDFVLHNYTTWPLFNFNALWIGILSPGHGEVDDQLPHISTKLLLIRSNLFPNCRR